MSQSIAIMVLGSPYANTSTQTALHFAESVLATGNTIERLFFYHDAVYTSTSLSIASQDEINLPQAWCDFINKNQLEAIVCIASGLKRGIIDTQESKRYEKDQHSLNANYELSGLGQWIEAVQNANQQIVFGA